MSEKEQPFFVGYLPIPDALRPALLILSIAAIACFAMIAYSVGSTQDDPGDGRAFGRQTLTGVIETQPYPILHVIDGTERIMTGDTVMLSGTGKFGVEPQAGRVAGGLVKVTGVILQRGSIRMLQVPNPNRNLAEVEGDVVLPEVKDLGRWRLAGEVCDGKCVAGAMRPGRGIAHKACAELCILGGVPPVFVTTQPVEGHEFMMIGSEDGGKISDAVLDKTGVYISVEGQVELRGDIAVFLIDEETIEVLP